MGLIRDSFVIFKDWANAINALPEEYQLETYKALVDFGFCGQIPQGLSPIANAMLISFSTGMQNSILRYNASVENGRLGGRPRKELSTEQALNQIGFYNENVVESAENVDNLPQNSVDNSIKNLEKPRKTQQNLEKPSHNLNKPSLTQPNLDEPKQNLNVNDNVNVFSQSNKKYNNNLSCVRVREKSTVERAFLVDKFKEFWKYHPGDDNAKLSYEVIDTLIEASQQARSDEKLLFDGQVYDFDKFYSLIDKLQIEDLEKIVWSLKSENDEHLIKNPPYYILGAAINRANER